MMGVKVWAGIQTRNRLCRTRIVGRRRHHQANDNGIARMAGVRSRDEIFQFQRRQFHRRHEPIKGSVFGAVVQSGDESGNREQVANGRRIGAADDNRVPAIAWTSHSVQSDDSWERRRRRRRR